VHCIPPSDNILAPPPCGMSRRFRRYMVYRNNFISAVVVAVTPGHTLAVGIKIDDRDVAVAFTRCHGGPWPTAVLLAGLDLTRKMISWWKGESRSFQMAAGSIGCGMHACRVISPGSHSLLLGGRCPPNEPMDRRRRLPPPRAVPSCILLLCKACPYQYIRQTAHYQSAAPHWLASTTMHLWQENTFLKKKLWSFFVAQKFILIHPDRLV
jgi:hypothetical protein